MTSTSRVKHKEFSGGNGNSLGVGSGVLAVAPSLPLSLKRLRLREIGPPPFLETGKGRWGEIDSSNSDKSEPYSTPSRTKLTCNYILACFHTQHVCVHNMSAYTCLSIAAAIVHSQYTTNMHINTTLAVI